MASKFIRPFNNFRRTVKIHVHVNLMFLIEMCKLIFINLLFLTFQNIKIYSFYRNIEILAFIFFFALFREMIKIRNKMMHFIVNKKI